MLVLGPKNQRDLLLDLTMNLKGSTFGSNKTVKDLGVTLDPDLSFHKHLKTFQEQPFTIFVTLQNPKLFVQK